MPYLKNYRDTILINAKAIILISPVYVLKLKTILSEKIWNQIKSKIAVIPNGIDKGYFINRVSHKKNYDSIIKIIYVGMFTRNKNIIRLMKAILKLNQEKNVSLTIVGDGGREQNRIEKLIKKNKYNFVNYIGYIKDINKLIELYRQHDIFAMVSFHETFGLVYIEALSQGLSIVYSAKEGVDGYFPENCNYAKKADPKSIDDICDAIKYIINSLKSNRSECLEKSSEFNWKKIAKRYIELYENF